MKGELKKYELRSSSRLGDRTDVLQMVQISRAGVNTHYCYIRFAEAFVEFIGKKLPQGVGPKTRVLLSADQNESGTWDIYAGCWDQLLSSRVLLWSAQETPQWLKFHKLKRCKDGNNAQTPRRPAKRGKPA